MLNINKEIDNFNHFWVGMPLPTLCILATNNKEITLAASIGHPVENPVVVYCYSQINLSDPSTCEGTRQTCTFRDRFQEFKRFGITVYGLGAENTEHQKEVVQRLALPFELLSNGDPAVWGSVSDTLGLPKFQVDGKFFLKPVAFIIENDRVVEIFEQAKTPEQNANDVLAWFYNRQAQA